MSQEADWHDRILVNPDVHDGQPCTLTGHVPLCRVLISVAETANPEGTVAVHPDLGPQDVEAALRFAAEAVEASPGDRGTAVVVDERWWKPLVEFLIQVILGSLLFVIIFAPAVGLNFLVKWLSAQGITSLLVYIVTAAEYILVLIDLAVYVAFLLRTAWRSILRMWK